MPSLRKLIVIDSYAASRIREVRLNGHVHVSGRNGRGKTTLIRLIPLFYGEQPSRIVRSAGSVVRSLREFMFNRSTSYVAFEYENHDGIKLAILHYGSDNSPQYHLADGPYAKDIFVENGQLIEGRHLNARLRTLGRNPSGALGVLQYRAVIQGTTARLTAPEHRPLVRRFALVATRSRLAGIERISSGMFSKDITFVALKRMAASVACDDEEGKQIVLALSRKELESFLPDFKAYHAVMALEPTFHAANSAYVQGNAARHQQARAAGKLKRLVLALGWLHGTLRQKARDQADLLDAIRGFTDLTNILLRHLYNRVEGSDDLRRRLFEVQQALNAALFDLQAAHHLVEVLLRLDDRLVRQADFEPPVWEDDDNLPDMLFRFPGFALPSYADPNGDDSDTLLSLLMEIRDDRRPSARPAAQCAGSFDDTGEPAPAKPDPSEFRRALKLLLAELNHHAAAISVMTWLRTQREWESLYPYSPVIWLGTLSCAIDNGLKAPDGWRYQHQVAAPDPRWETPVLTDIWLEPDAADTTHSSIAARVPV